MCAQQDIFLSPRQTRPQTSAKEAARTRLWAVPGLEGGQVSRAARPQLLQDESKRVGFGPRSTSPKMHADGSSSNSQQTHSSPEITQLWQQDLVPTMELPSKETWALAPQLQDLKPLLGIPIGPGGLHNQELLSCTPRLSNHAKMKPMVQHHHTLQRKREAPGQGGRGRAEFAVCSFRHLRCEKQLWQEQRQQRGHPCLDEPPPPVGL